MMAYPRDFLWGVAASAYQIEGATDRDGRAPSIWDAFVRRTNAVKGGHTGDLACDHYERYRDDVAILARLGVGAYRLSIAWPRVIPEGTGAANDRGLDFYDRLVDELLERGIEPWVTLFHWDFPLELFWRGGWLNRDSADWFADYAAVVVARLSDRVRSWMTLNEPQCYIGLGHYLGVHAPGLVYSRPDVLRATHNTLRAHGKAVLAIRAAAVEPPRVGWAPVGWVCYPRGGDDDDLIEAAREATFHVSDDPRSWPLNNSWYADPVVLGHYPQEGLERFGKDLPPILSGDMETIQQPLDFYGVNIYQGTPIVRGLDGVPEKKPRRRGHPETLMGWTVDPETLYWGPRFLAERYGLPIYVTENGVAGEDWVQTDGRVRDPQRIDFLTRYLVELRRAVSHGVDVRGYFQWSAFDNFEWELGYSRRFGLVYVDFETQERIAKDSFDWYARTIQTNGSELPDAVEPLR